MVSLGKTIRNALAEGKDWRTELQAFLRSYRSTLHRTTGIAPSEALFGSNRTRPRLPHVSAPDDKHANKNCLKRSIESTTGTRRTDLKRKAVKHNFKIGIIYTRLKFIYILGLQENLHYLQD